MAQQVELVMQVPDFTLTQVQFLELTWWEERTDFTKLPSDTHTHMHECTHTHTGTYTPAS